MTAYEQYIYELKDIPPPGGNGCHPFLLRVANFARFMGLTPEQAFADIRANIPEGDRPVFDSEIWEAIEKGFSTECPERHTAREKIIVEKAVAINYEPAFHSIVSKGLPLIKTGGLQAMSPVAIPEDPLEHKTLLLKQLYKAHEHIFIGLRTADSPVWGCKLDYQQLHILPASEWIEFFENTPGCDGEFQLICANPITGQTGRTKLGKLSLRCDDCVCGFKYAVGEIDKFPKGWSSEGEIIPKETQAAFWAALIAEGVPVACIIDSGGKSLHAWLHAGCDSRGQWETEIENGLFPTLVHFGVDGACRNEGRLSRFPGVVRTETEQYQKLVYLNNVKEI